jgi:SAM-dependent methyltransferase
VRKVSKHVGLGPSNNEEIHLDAFDARYGTDTATIVGVGALDIPDERLDQTNRYEAIAPEVFDSIIEDLLLPFEQFVFVDIGSGKGRALLLASLLPFKETIGVEISPTLTRIAESNIRKFDSVAQRCCSIRTICTDGGAYQPPPDNCLLYLYNPFGHAVMQRFLANVEEAIREKPRKIFVVYLTPLQRVLWDRSEMFRVVRDKGQVVVYESR